MKKKHTIMTIDDEDSIRMLIESVLTQNGYRALAADSGAKGLELAQGESVDLILLDVNMPEMNGREVVQRLRANPDTRTIPVIMLTGNNSAKDKVQGLNAGADEYVTKPVSGTELVARIRALLRMKELQDDVLQLEREKHLAQLTLAKSIQQSLIPQELPQIPGLDLAVRYQSCDIIGGD
ncbi:MAG: response regulator, partial [Planctomycetota bacterium]|nr:response regulator [Planctomycetota bacterium]